MPNYEYRCAACKRTFEKIRSLASRDEALPCPHCKSTRTTRVVVQRIARLKGARPDFMAGEGEPEDFAGGVDDWGDDDF